MQVNAGAQLQTSDGGRIMLLSQNVTNKGTIDTPNGQTILGAGNQVMLAATTDSAMRGLLIAVNGNGLASNSTVTNQGTITAEHGNITLAGMMVNQSGQINATTSVNANGSIYLMAGDVSATSAGAPLQYFTTSTSNTPSGSNPQNVLPNNGGELTLSSGSTTEVTPDNASQATITGGATFNSSDILLVGKTVNITGNSQVVAHGGEIDIQAYNQFSFNQQQLPITTVPAPSDGSRVFIDQGSVVDASGLQNVAVSASTNLIQVNMGANELQNDPLLRNGWLHGQTVTINVNQGTPLLTPAELSAYAKNIGQTVEQKLTAGGSIIISSGGDTIVKQGATLNVSGGSTQYTASHGQASELIGADGKVYSISNAPNTVQYIGFADQGSVSDSKWGTTSSWTSPAAYLPGYIQGADGGTLQIKGPQIALQGTLLGNTTIGTNQRTPPAANTPAPCAGYGTAPCGGTLLIGDQANSKMQGTEDLHAPNILLSNSVTLLPTSFGVNDTLSSSEQQTLTLSPQTIEQGGFSTVGLYTNGSLSSVAGANLTLPGNGSFLSVAGTVNLAGNITIPQGTVNIAATTGDLDLAAGTRIATRGNWINDSGTIANNSANALIDDNGGSITLASANNVVLGNAGLGASLDASGGGWVNTGNTLSAGSAGSISLLANDGSKANEVPSSPPSGTVQLNNSSLAAYGLKQGGSLSVNTASITIGSQSSDWTGDLLLGANFFNTGGFQTFSLNGANHFQVDSGATIAPQAQNRLLNGNYLQQATGSNIDSFSHLGALPIEQQGPISLNFSTSTPLYPNSNSTRGLANTGDLLINSGSSITLGANTGSKITLSAAENLTVAGQISVPAGQINLISSTQSNASEGIGDQLLLTATARLYAGGAAVINTDNAKGYAEGQILNGGSISLNAKTGFVVTDPGSLLDVSSATQGHGVLDLTGTNHGVTTVTPTLIYSNAGSISISAQAGLVLQGSLSGAAGSSSAAAGTLNIALSPAAPSGYVNAQNSNGYYPGATPFADIPDVLTVTNDNLSNTTLTPTAGQAWISMPLLQQGGFDNIKLSSGSTSTQSKYLQGGNYAVDSILFQYSVLNPAASGSINLDSRQSLAIDAPVIAVAAGTQANLNSAYIDFGHQYGVSSVPAGSSFSADTGSLTAQAQLIDLSGNTDFSGSALTLHSTGDIRAIYATDTTRGNINTDFSASLTSSGDVTLDAAQVYPVTNTAFTLNAGSNTVTISNSTHASSSTPLSAGGSLTIDAGTIDQLGTLRAPLGKIDLVASNALTLQPGSLTSVSADGLTIPYGSTQNGSAWVYQNSSDGSSFASVSTAPTKQITLNGSSVAVLNGAKVDLSGGGDLYAYEFIAGPGGASDVLAPATNANKAPPVYAIVPSLGAGNYAPVDYQYVQASQASNAGGQNNNIAVGSQVYLSSIPGLAAGYYTLMPARYALLPGAFEVQLQQANSNLALGNSIAQANGSYAVAGFNAMLGSATHDSQTSTFTLTPNAVVNQQAQYTSTSGNTFFNSQNKAGGTLSTLPVDAGQLQIVANTSLTLNGNVNFSSASQGSGSSLIQGQGGTAMISAPNIDVVDNGQTGSNANALDINVNALDGLHANTLVLGAVLDSNGNLNANSTQQVTVDASATALTAGNVILAAGNQVTVANGAAINATGTSDSRTPDTFTQAGAILELSGSATASVNRASGDTTSSGLVQVGAKANLNAGSGAIIFDGLSDTNLDNSVNLQAAAITLAANGINLGNAPVNANGLTLSNSLLATLQSDPKFSSLTLHSYGDINLYSGLNLGSTQPLAQITLNSQGLQGYGNGTETISAANITLLGNGAGPSAGPSGNGSLALNASQTLTVGGSGSGSISGFSTVNLNSAGDIQAAGSGQWQVYGNLNLSSQRVDGQTGAVVSLGSSGNLTIASATANGKAPTLTSPDLGASLSLSAGGNLTQGGNIATPGGVLSLNAGNNLTLSSGSSTSASGVAQPFHDVTAYAPAGTVNLAAQQGNITIASGADVNVAGAVGSAGDGGAAGTLNLQASQGTLQLQGNLQGSAGSGQRQGRVSIDVGNLGANNSNLNPLLASLQQSGFGASQSLRVRSGNLAVGQNITAQNINLSADQGAIAVSSTLDSRGANGGTIALWAQGNVALNGGAQLLANATTSTALNAGQGGAVTLGSSAGQVLANAGTSSAAAPMIDVRGQASDGSQDGQVQVRVLSSSGTSNAQLGAATIRSSHATTVEEVTVYQVGGGTVLDPGDTYQLGQSGPLTVLGGYSTSGGSNIAQDMSTIASSAPNSSSFVYRPGIEIDSTGSLTMGSSAGDNWDFSSVSSPWTSIANNSGGSSVPINLTLRATGNLTLAGSLSAGFNGNTLLNGDSSSLRLVAGADLSAANPLAILPTSGTAGSFVLMPGQLVRTGTGNISVAAQGDINLGNIGNIGNIGNSSSASSKLLAAEQASVIYTAGVPSTDPGSAYNLPSGTAKAPIHAELPTNGGNLSLNAGHDIIAAPSNQLISNWEWRLSSTNKISKVTTNVQWIEFEDFQEGIGALGGGNVDVTAGHDITNLSAVIPATLYTTISAGVAAPEIVHGGGNLTVQAGNDINSGLYYVDHGTGTITAGGSIGPGSLVASDTVSNGGQAPVYTILAQSNATLTASALGSITIAGDYDPSLLPISTTEKASVPTFGSSFYYLSAAPTDLASFTSLAGDVNLMNSDILTAIPSTSIPNTPVPAATYPATLNVQAFTGSINTSDLGSMAVLPSATGNLSWLADNNINIGSPLTVSEADTAQLSTADTLWQSTIGTIGEARPTTTLLGTLFSANPSQLAATPIHSGDNTPITVIASQGSIYGNNVDITVPKQAEFYAGTDISNLAYTGKNMNGTVTTFTAGDNITYNVAVDVNNALTSNGSGITVAGNGWAELLAGGNISLGNSNGVVTDANTNDVRLPATGASILVAAGLGHNPGGGPRAPDYQDFINTYITGTSTTRAPQVYSNLLISFMENLDGTGTLTASQAATDFAALTRAQQLPLIAQVLYAELNANAVAHNTTGTDYSRGRAAIATLFPGKDSSGNTLAYQGDLNMFFSELKTDQGGDIDLLLPGGSAVVGVPNPPAILNSTKSDTCNDLPGIACLGLLTLGTGGIYGYTADNFNVNQSRILTLQGGNILLWADTGNIDAGRGANTASAAPPPVVLTDANGNVYVDPAGDISGSGIGQLLTVPGNIPGFVDLIAPEGIVNAGDAGIRVAGNLNIAALQVVGAGNIHVGGASTGVPVNEAGALAGSLSGAGGLSDTAEQATDDVTKKIAADSADTQKLENNFQPSLISVEMICLGSDCDNQ